MFCNACRVDECVAKAIFSAIVFFFIALCFAHHIFRMRPVGLYSVIFLYFSSFATATPAVKRALMYTKKRQCCHLLMRLRNTSALESLLYAGARSAGFSYSFGMFSSSHRNCSSTFSRTWSNAVMATEGSVVLNILMRALMMVSSFSLSPNSKSAPESAAASCRSTIAARAYPPAERAIAFTLFSSIAMLSFAVIEERMETMLLVESGSNAIISDLLRRDENLVSQGFAQVRTMGKADDSI